MKCARIMAYKLNLKHYIHYFDEEESQDAVRFVVRTLRVFDPMEVRNSITIFIGLKLTKEIGVKSIMTGDALDELMAGYPWFFNREEKELDLKLQKIWDTMVFSSILPGKALRNRG